jgi:hypothetical protein
MLDSRPPGRECGRAQANPAGIVHRTSILFPKRLTDSWGFGTHQENETRLSSVLPVDDAPIVRVLEEFRPISANNNVNGAVLDAHEKRIRGGDAERSVRDAGARARWAAFYIYVDGHPDLKVEADGDAGDAGVRAYIYISERNP